VLQQLEVHEALWKMVDAAAFFRMCFSLGPAVRRVTSSFLSMTSTVG
jgi:hypothetical protein